MSSLTLYSCKECPKSYPLMSSLKRHTKYHTGDLFHCSICKKGFPTASEQRRHLGKCTGENLFSFINGKKVFTCKICEQMFLRVEDLERHFLKFHSNLESHREVEINQKINSEANKKQLCEQQIAAFKERKWHEKIQDDEYLANDGKSEEVTDVSNSISIEAFDARKNTHLVKSIHVEDLNHINNEGGWAQWNGLKNKESIMILKEENDSEISTTIIIPDSSGDKANKEQDIVNEKENDDYIKALKDEQLYEKYSDYNHSSNQSKDSKINSTALPKDNSQVQKSSVEDDKQDKTHSQSGKYNDDSVRINILRQQTFLPNFCHTCQQDFYDNRNLIKHMNTRDHEAKLWANLFRKNADEAFSKNTDNGVNKSNAKDDYFVSESIPLSHGAYQKEVDNGLEKKAQCRYCATIFSTKANLRSHIRQSHLGGIKHRKVKTVPCLHCQKMFVRKAHMIEHINIVHEGKKMIYKDIHCHFCGKPFTHKRSLNLHISSSHADVGPVQSSTTQQFNEMFTDQNVNKNAESISANGLPSEIFINDQIF